MTPADTVSTVPDSLSRRRRVASLLRDRTFLSLQIPDYRRYFLGQVISLSGSWMQSAALLWLVYATTNDPRWPPLMLVAQTLPTLVFGTLGGALADRFPRRGLIISTQLSYLGIAAVLTGLIATGYAVPGVLLAAQVANGIVQAVDLPARLAFVPSLVPRSSLVNAVALNSLLFNSARAIGPALAGAVFLMAHQVHEQGWTGPLNANAVGAAACVALNGLSYLVVIGALLRIRERGLPPPGPTRMPGLLAGVRTVAASRRLGGYLLGAGLLGACVWPVLPVFPAYTVEVLGCAVTEYSVLVSALGAGALIAAGLNATFGSVSRQGLFLGGGALGAAVGLLGLTLATGIEIAALSAGTLGAGLVLHLSTAQSALQLSVPDDARGRVMALWPMTLSLGTLVGNGVVSVAVAGWGIRVTLAGMTAGAVLLAAGWLIARARPSTT